MQFKKCLSQGLGKAFLSIAVLIILAIPGPAQAANVLMLGPSLGFGINEATHAIADGHTVTVDTAATWSARSTASFASFDAIVIGDRGCAIGTLPLAAAEANAAVWGAAVSGNVVSYGYDPAFGGGDHGGFPQAIQLVKNAINFAAGGGGTGLVMSLGCYYFSAAAGTPVISLGGLGFGPITVTGQGPLGLCNGVSFDDPGHPVLAGLTPAGIGFTGCSVHGVFDTPLPSQCVSIARSTGANQPWIIVCEDRKVAVDIKPQSCPNPLNVNSKGVLPVAILGSADLDVLDIELVSLTLVGIAPIRVTFEDVATPFVGDKNNCLDCTTEGPDGFLDLSLKFDMQQIVNAIGPVQDGDCLALPLDGELDDGTPFTGEDVIIIRKKK